WDTAVRKRVLICVSREEHCLSDLLHRWRSGDLECEIVGVVSNHDELRHLVEWHEIPWHRIDLDGGPGKKAAGFGELSSIFEAAGGDVMVLARVMPIIPPAEVWRLSPRPGSEEPHTPPRRHLQARGPATRLSRVAGS